MIHYVQIFALAMAVISAIMAFRTGRTAAAPDTRRGAESTMLIATAVMAGVTPQVLLPSVEWLQDAGPLLSIALSVGTLVFLRRTRVRARA